MTPPTAVERPLAPSPGAETSELVPEAGSPERISPQGHTAGAAALKAWRESGGHTGPRLNPIQRAAANPTSLRLAIRAKCYDCVGQDADPNWQRRVGTCGCTSCPLHAVRPYRRGADHDEDAS